MNKTAKSLTVIGVGVLFLTSVGMAAASELTTKSSPLYPIKMALEAVTLASASQENKAVVQAAQVDERVAELQILKTKIDELEKNQKLEAAAKLQLASDATRLEAKKSADEARSSASLISDQSKKEDVLKRIEVTESQLDDNDEDETEEVETEEVEAPEPEEEAEASETKESEGVKNDN